MYLQVVKSHRCALHQIQVPYGIRKELGIDLGDWLLFDTIDGVFSVVVVNPYREDSIRYNNRISFVHPDSSILFSKCGDVILKPHEITIGCDPEFFIIDKTQKTIIPACNYLPFDEKIGSDAELGELRPDYALCPEQLMKNLNSLVKKVDKSIPVNTFPYAASSYGPFCCGFHVHIGLPIEVLSFAAENTDGFLKNMASILDYLVGIPALALDPDEKRKASKTYGQPSDYRLHMRTFEYRTPGGFHLKTPEYTMSLFSAAFKTAEKIIELAEIKSDGWCSMYGVHDLSFFRKLYGIPEISQVKRLYISGTKEERNAELAKIFRILMEIMADYTEYIIKVRQQEQPDFTKEWAENEAKLQTNFYQEVLPT